MMAMYEYDIMYYTVTDQPRLDSELTCSTCASLSFAALL